jgi:acetylornithine deacetylase/succinyl-diaminopimelate desuccinylase-like protein
VATEQSVLGRVREHRAAAGWDILAEFAGLLALPNVTGDLPALRRNAAAIAAALAGRGVLVEVVERDGAAPLVLGRLDCGVAGAARVGVYAHYDGQPVDGGGWESPPFAPTLRDGTGAVLPLAGAGAIGDDWRLYARAAADDKAPVAALLAALDALATHGVGRAVDLVLCLEGEEESGSTHLRAYLDALRDRLAADVWLICDGPVHVSGAPQVVLGVRGYCGLELTVYGPAREVHSGHYGNWVPNPAMTLAHLLASMKSADGTVLVDGFHDLTRRPGPAEQALLDALPAVEPGLLDSLGIAAAEVPGSRLVDRLMLASLNVRGLAAAGVGAAARDDPDRMPLLVRAHLERHGVHVLDREPTAADRRAHPVLARLDPHPGYPAARADADLPVVAHLAALAGRAAGRPALRVPTLGGSVPLHDMTAALGAPTVILPIANPDNNQHAANENLRLGQLWYGMDLFSLLLTTPYRP